MHELRGVGKNMQDHYVARVSYPVVGAQTANERSRGLPLAGDVMRWLFTGKGMLTYGPSIVAASVKVLEGSATPDVQVTFAPGSFKGGQIGELEETPGLHCICIHSNQTGSLSDMSADTMVLTTRIDAALNLKLEALARSTKRSKSFLAAEAIAAYVELNEWQIGEITDGIKELDSGETLSEQQAEERYNRLLQPG